MKEEWNSVTTTSGEQCVMTAGEYLMPQLSVDNLVTLTRVSMKVD